MFRNAFLDFLFNLGTIDEAADAGYDTAMGMCGNSGQVSVIDMTGYSAFHDAASAMAEGGDGLGILLSACPYPEAVSEILEESAAVMEGIVGEGLEWAYGAGEEGEEGEEGEGEFEE